MRSGFQLSACLLAVLLTFPATAQWAEGFEAHAPGPLVPQGGWELWYQGGDQGIVTNGFAASGVNSLRMQLPGLTQGGTDVVRRFNILSGKWVFRCMTYVPSGAGGIQNRDGYLLLMNNYNGAPDPNFADNWSMQVRFSAGQNIVESQFDGAILPLITDQWVEFRAEIDLAANTFSEFYGGQTLAANLSWTENVSGGGKKTIACLDVYSDSIDGMFVDDISLLPACPSPCPADLDCDGSTNQADLGILLADYGCSAGPGLCPGDVNGDGKTDQSDLGILLAFYGCDGTQPPQLSDFAFGQLDWLDTNGIPLAIDSDWGSVEMTIQPNPYAQWYLNIVADAGKGPAWIVHNYPVFPAPLMNDPRQLIDIEMLELSLTGGPVHSLQAWYTIDLVPITYPQNLNFLGGFPVQDVIRQASGDKLTPVLPNVGKPAGHKAQEKPKDVVQHTNVGGIQEDKDHCLCGAFARSIKWLDREYNLNSGKTIQQIYDDLKAAGVSSEATTYEQDIEAKQKYLNGLKAGSTTTVCDPGDIVGATPTVPQVAGDVVEFLEKELKAGKDVELHYGGHIVTITGFYRQGEKIFVKYRDDENQGDKTKGDTAEKEAELVKVGGKWQFRRKDGLPNGDIKVVVSESVPK